MSLRPPRLESPFAFGPLVPGLGYDDLWTVELWLCVWCVWNKHQQLGQGLGRS